MGGGAKPELPWGWGGRARAGDGHRRLVLLLAAGLLLLLGLAAVRGHPGGGGGSLAGRAGRGMVQEAPWYRRTGAYPGPAWNVARGKAVEMSSQRSHRKGRFATDGETLGFYEASGGANGYAETRLTDDPWLMVDLGQEHALKDVDVWAPQLHCKTALVKTKKHDTPETRPGKCKEHLHTMEVDAARPLVVEVLNAARQPVAQRVFDGPHKVYTWGDVGVAGRWVRVRAEGRQRLLAVAEVRAYAEGQPGGRCRAGGDGNCFHGK